MVTDKNAEGRGLVNGLIAGLIVWVPIVLTVLWLCR